MTLTYDDYVFCLKKVRENPDNLFKYRVPQTPELCLAAVEQNGLLISAVQYKTPEICLAAVRESSTALYYIEKQTPELCLEAVKSFGWALQFVKVQTPEICLAAVKQYGSALRYVKNQTEELCLAKLFNLRINEITDPDMFKWLSAIENVPQYLRQLIRKDMDEHKS